MRDKLPEKLEAGRVLEGERKSQKGDTHGAFQVLSPIAGFLRILSSGTGKDSEGWEHVSVSLSNRTPTWAEMCFVKDLFWDEQEVVMQLHPARSDYVNNHQHCLHLWRPINEKLPIPPGRFVGILGLTLK